MKKTIGIMAVLAVAMAMLTSCQSAGYVKELDYKFNFNSEDLVYGDIITYEQMVQANLRSVYGIQAAQQIVVNAALDQYPEWDLLVFQRFDLEYSGFAAYSGGGKVNIKVTGRLAKVKQ